jgi:hypothetical protein
VANWRLASIPKYLMTSRHKTGVGMTPKIMRRPLLDAGARRRRPDHIPEHSRRHTVPPHMLAVSIHAHATRLGRPRMEHVCVRNRGGGPRVRRGLTARLARHSVDRDRDVVNGVELSVGGDRAHYIRPG